MGGGHHVGAGRVDLGVDGERGRVDRPVALDHLAVVVDQDQVGDPDVAEVHAEGVDPEVVESLGVAGGDVAGHALVEAELREQAEGGGQPLLAVEALLLGVCVGSRGQQCLGHGVLLGSFGRPPSLRPWSRVRRGSGGSGGRGGPGAGGRGGPGDQGPGDRGRAGGARTEIGVRARKPPPPAPAIAVRPPPAGNPSPRPRRRRRCTARRTPRGRDKERGAFRR